jgi:hypothetical protein
VFQDHFVAYENWFRGSYRDVRFGLLFRVPLKKIIRRNAASATEASRSHESTQAKATGNRLSSLVIAFTVGCSCVWSLKLAVQSSKCSRSAALARCSQYSASASSSQLLSGWYAALCRHNDAIARKRRTVSIPILPVVFPTLFFIFASESL